MRRLTLPLVGTVILALLGGLRGAAAAQSDDGDATGTFGLTGSLAEPRTYHTATLLTDGRVLVVGGVGDHRSLASVEVWEPAE